jgi:hypothetical protein
LCTCWAMAAVTFPAQCLPSMPDRQRKQLFSAALIEKR